MSSRSLDYIQDADDNPSLANCNSRCKKLSDCITRNKLISQVDFFSLDVKFLIKGQEAFKTIFSGLMGLAVVLILGIITYFIAWPSSFSSKITEIEYNKDINSTGLSLFSYSDEPISFSLTPKSPNIPVSIPSQFSIKLYYMKTGEEPLQIKWDTNCKHGNYCLTTNVANGNIFEIYGGFSTKVNASLKAEVFWCQVFTPGCPMPLMFDFQFSFENMRKKREKKMVPMTDKIRLKEAFGLFSQYIYDFQVSRQQFTSNNKILGHISNLLPQTFTLYRFNQFPEITPTSSPPPLVTPGSSSMNVLFVSNFVYSQKIFQINEVFVNIITPILFFFSLLDPFKWLVNQLLLKRYNKNCRDLYIANKLYYVQDVQSDQKYNFSRGPTVFIICLIHRHPLTLLFVKLLTLCGKNLVDVLPAKCIHIMNMINKGSSLMCENVFFGGLEELSTLEDCPGKKIPFNNVDTEQDDQEEEQPQLNYFPQNPVRQAAFANFCKDNDYYSARRKNKVYEILLDNKFTTFLKDGLHKQFQGYVKNIQNLKAKGKFQDDADINLPVQLVQPQQDKGEETHSGFKFAKMQSP